MTAFFNTAHGRGVLVATAGVFIISFDAVLVRLAVTSEWNIAFWRGWLIFVSLTVVQITRGDWRGWWPALRAERVAMVAVILLYGVDTVLFVLSVANTRAANTVVILASSPFFAALFTWLFLRERIAPRTWVAIITATAGVFIVFAGGAQIGTAIGDFYALLLALFMGAGLTVLRRYPNIRRIPAVWLSGAAAGLLCLPFADPFAMDATAFAAVGIMGLVQMPLAMVLITTATRYLPSPEVSLFLLIETVLGPLWVWMAVGEQPPTFTVYGGALILATVAVHSWVALRQSPRPSAVAVDEPEM